jgi:hypothetical protein
MSRIGLVTALLALAALPACGNGADEESVTTTELADRLESLPAVSSAQVKKSDGIEELEGVFTWVATVDMEDDATAEEITGVLDVFAENDDLGDGFHGLVRRAGDSIRYDNDGDNLPNADVAALLMRGATVFSDDAVELTSFGSLTVPLTAKGTGAVTEAADLIAEDEALSGLDRVTVAALAPDDPAPAPAMAAISDAPYYFVVRRGFTTQLREAWSALADSLAEAPNEPVALSLTPDERDDGIDIQTKLELPGNVTESELTTDAYGGKLAALIHAQLDVLAELPTRSQLTMHNWSESDVDVFLYVTAGESGPGVDDEGRTWNADAYEYLSR